jgi:hypothetical protein
MGYRTLCSKCGKSYEVPTPEEKDCPDRMCNECFMPPLIKPLTSNSFRNMLLERSGFQLYEFQAFTSHMARTLLKHSEKGRSWETCKHSYLVQKLLDEVNEYIKGRHDKEELIDIANMCLMLYLRED